MTDRSGLNISPPPRRQQGRRLLGVVLGTATLMATSAVVAYAAPPQGLPQNATGMEQTFSPAYD